MKFKLNNAVVPLLSINIILFIVQLSLKGFTENFMLVAADAFTRPWILVTSMFMHANATHLFFNMYVLLIFGPLLEQRIGTKRFIFIYFLSGILASLASTAFYPLSLGASGAIMGMMGVTIMLFPDIRVLFFFVIPMSLRTAGIVIALIDIIGVFNPGGNIANVAHLAGLGCGLIYGYSLIRQKNKFTIRFEKNHIKSHNRKSRNMSNKEIDDYLKYGKL